MTTFVAWVGVDSRGTASINFATDSRISWGNSERWDMARKTFSSNSSPDIFAYVNDVMFPSMILGQIVNAIDSGGLFVTDDTCDERFKKVEKHIKNSHEFYPAAYRESFCIFHGARQGIGIKSEFKLNTVAWDKITSKWTVETLTIPLTSSVITVDGSGGKIVRKWSERWNSSSQGGTSRAVFSSFCNAVYSGEDEFTNGSPQIVSLYRKDFGKTVGFVSGGRSFISGIEVLDFISPFNTQIEWRNRYFERCNTSGDIISGAKKHHVPRGLE